MPGAFQLLTYFSMLLLPFLVADAIYGSRMQRAVLRVVLIFWDHNAIGIHNARTLEQLGLTGEERTVLDSRERRALLMLIEGGIIRTAESETLYIPEKNFANFALFLKR